MVWRKNWDSRIPFPPQDVAEAWDLHERAKSWCSTWDKVHNRTNRVKKMTFREWAVCKCYLDYDAIELMEEAFNAGKENA